MNIHLFMPKVSWLNDLALVKLEKDIPAGRVVVNDIQTIQLPKQGEAFPNESAECVMAGWGCRSGGKYTINNFFQILKGPGHE